jgi:hypothetical protein
MTLRLEVSQIITNEGRWKLRVIKQSNSLLIHLKMNMMRRNNTNYHQLKNKRRKLADRKVLPNLKKLFFKRATDPTEENRLRLLNNSSQT